MVGRRLDYGRMMQRAMRTLMAEALGIVAAEGLPGDHHFYISFRTDHPGVDLPDWLRAQYPQDLTIVLQYEYRELVVTHDRFSVLLSFRDRPARLVVPFDAVTTFADPSVEFGLRFDQIGEMTFAENEDEDEDEEDTPPPPKPEGGGEVVSLDKFRRK